jgi:two-component system, OmpR family, response regulator
MGASMEWTARTRRQEDRFPVRGAACVVEPDNDARAEIADALRNMGYTTHETGSGAVGAFIADQIHLQVALVNLVLPDAKGLQLIRRVRAKCPDAVIVALAGAGSFGLGAMLAQFAGADTSVAAPPSVQALSAAVTEAGHAHEGA